MRHQQNRFLQGVLLLTLSAVGLSLGCSSAQEAPAEPGATTVSPIVLEKGGAELWSENCGRCHNIRSPSQFSDDEWQVFTHHMRVRANLTGEQTRKILEFLKAAN